jgi:hypothetical protein
MEENNYIAVSLSFITGVHGLDRIIDYGTKE